MKALRLLLCGLAMGYGFPAACGSGGIVGGDCRSGYTNCNGECVDLRSDPDHCGRCDNNCDGTLACVMALCGGEDGSVMVDAGVGGNGNEAGQNGGGNSGNGQGGDGVLPDGGNFDSPVDGEGDGSADAACLPPFDTAQHCGDCDTRCVPPTPICSPVDMGFQCVPMCEDPLTQCGTQCVDLNIDPENCGECGNVCPSGICQAGDCVGAEYGDIVLLCMNFATTIRQSAQATVLGNAVFAPLRNEVRILAYSRGADAAVVSRVNQVIGWQAETRSRAFDLETVTDASAVQAQLNVLDYDVFLVYDLSKAKSGEPGAAGNSWASSTVVSSFARAGGVVIVLDGGGGTGEMPELIANAGLLPVTGHSDITGDNVYNQAPFDAIGSNVVSPFKSSTSTCTFSGASEETLTLFVLTDAENGGSPVAVHTVLLP